VRLAVQILLCCLVRTININFGMNAHVYRYTIIIIARLVKLLPLVSKVRDPGEDSVLMSKILKREYLTRFLMDRHHIQIISDGIYSGFGRGVAGVLCSGLHGPQCHLPHPQRSFWPQV
jgi:hypothetical protein